MRFPTRSLPERRNPVSTVKCAPPRFHSVRYARRKLSPVYLFGVKIKSASCEAVDDAFRCKSLAFGGSLAMFKVLNLVIKFHYYNDKIKQNYDKTDAPSRVRPHTRDRSRPRGLVAATARQRRGIMVRASATVFFATISSFFACGAAQYAACYNGTLSAIGDGQCDDDNNNASCGFDGGDVSAILCWCTLAFFYWVRLPLPTRETCRNAAHSDDGCRSLLRWEEESTKLHSIFRT